MADTANDESPNPDISVITVNPAIQQPECEMDALLLGRTGELVAASPGRRNWRGIFIALLVIAAVLGLIVFSIFLLSPEGEGSRVRGRRILLGDLNSNSFKWTPFNGTWISDSEIVYRDASGGLSILNLEKFSTRVLMTNTTFRQLNADKFSVSPDIMYVLLASETQQNGASKYHVYEVQTRNHFALSIEGVRFTPYLQKVLWAPNQNIKLSVASALAPSLLDPLGGTVGGISGVPGFNPGTSSTKSRTFSQAVAFVYNNDVYYKPKVQSDLVCKITTTGEAGFIYNGVSNWMYSNIPELKSETLAFSPDGMYLAFLQFNDTLVREYQYTWIGENQKYPSVEKIRYPKASTVNPNVTVLIANLSILKLIETQQIHLPQVVKNGSYIGGMIWISNKDLSITVTDRRQTTAITLLCKAPSFNCREIHAEIIVDNGCVIPAEPPVYSKFQTRFKYNRKPNIILNQTSDTLQFSTTIFQSINTSASEASKNLNFNSSNLKTLNSNLQNEFQFETGGYLLKRLPVRDGEHGYYRHVVFISPSDMRTVPITMGRFEVTEILGWDEVNDLVYFMATPETKPSERHLYKINLKLNATEKTTRVYITSTQPVCLTCDNSISTFHVLSNFNGETFSNSSLNEDENGFEIPNNCLYNKIYFSKGYSYYVQECLGPDTPSVYLVETSTNMKVYILNDGEGLRNRLTILATPQIRVFNVEIRHGFQAQVRLLLPPGMKEEEEVAFPLILHVDAAPGSQLVEERFQMDWNWYLCSQKSIIVAQIDARGSGYQGEMVRSQIKGRLGTVEIEDQLGVLSYLRENLKFVDPQRICAYGWGYGGYAVTMALIEDSGRVLQCAIAVNPIVSFAYYNSFFTERYISQDNDYLRALQDSDLTIRAGNLDTRNFFLIHGTADTDVHPQHSLMLSRALIDQGVTFRHHVYSDEDHQLSGARFHLFKTMETYFDDCFGPADSTDWDPTGFFASKQ